MPGDDAIRWAFAVGNLALAGLFGSLFVVLPVRYWAVDVPSVLLAGLSVWSALELTLRRGPRWRVPVLSACCDLTVGLCALSALALGMSYLGGIHGALARSSITVWLLGSLLVFPYLVIYPALQLLWLHARRPTCG
jgi:hypothetical protein